VRIVSFKEDFAVSFAKSSGTHIFPIKANEPYVFSNGQIQRLFIDQPGSEDKVLRITQLEGRLVNFNAQAYRSGSVMIYNGCGGYGDQIMTMPVAKILTQLGYDVHVLVDPGNGVCWDGLDFIKTVIPVPCHLSMFNLATYHIIYEIVTNNDEHPGQLHPVDTMLKRIGLDPMAFTPAEKTFRVGVLPEERTAVSALTEGKPYGVFQLSSASPARSLTADKSAFMLRNLAVKFPDLEWYALYDGFIPMTYLQAAKVEMPANVFPISFPKFREVFALIEGAKVCICPDSMVAHAAGSMNVPCVGLWGPTDPHLRVEYYGNHVALSSRASCPVSPCLVHRGALPPPFCPSLARRVCACVDDIEPSDILDAVQKILGT